MPKKMGCTLTFFREHTNNKNTQTDTQARAENTHTLKRSKH